MKWPYWVTVAFPLCCGVSVAVAQPQPYPSQAIKIVVPYPPGGATDLLARKMAEQMSPRLGQPVIVENRAGAGGTIGSQYVARANPDGYTLVVGVTGSHAISPFLAAQPAYDPVKDFAPVALLVTAPLILVAHPSVPAIDLQTFIAHARSKPGGVTFGSSGTGTSFHLAGELFSVAAGVKMVHVPYKGSAQAVADLVGGQIDSMFVDPPVLAPYQTGGKLKFLGATSKKRSVMLPDVPTMAEAGVADFEVLSWQGLFAPAGAPAAIVERLNREANAVLAMPEVSGFFSKQGFDVAGGSPADFQTFVAMEAKRWGQAVRQAGIVPQ